MTDGEPAREGVPGIVVAAPGSWPPARGPVQADRLVAALRSEGVWVRRVETWHPRPPLLARLPAFAESWERRRVRRDLRLALRRRAGVLHVHVGAADEFGERVQPAIDAARAAGLRVVARWDGVDAARFAETCGAAEARALRECDAIVAPGRLSARVLEDCLGVRPVVLPPLIPDPPAAPPPARSEGTFRVLVARSLRPGCGADTVVAAAARAGRRGADLALTLAGAGPGRARLETAARDALGERARFTGHVAPDALRALLAETDAFADGSTAADVPAVFAEALSFGVPLLTSAADAADGVVDHGRNGFVFAPGDADGLSSVFGALDTDRRLLENLGWNAKLCALRWTWAALREGWFGVWGTGARSAAA